MTPRPRQLALDLDYRPALDREDFLVSPANAAAVEAVDVWPHWAQGSLAICGDAGVGKTHLVEVWRSRSGGCRVAADELAEATLTRASDVGATAIEDIDRGIGDERILFHLFNLAREGRLTLLSTSRGLPGELAIVLPDLRSRMRAMALVRIEAPDEALLRALLVKLLADRQQAVAPAVIEYVIKRMERSAEAAIRFVKALDQRALETRRRLTARLAREVLDGLADPQ